MTNLKNSFQLLQRFLRSCLLLVATVSMLRADPVVDPHLSWMQGGGSYYLRWDAGGRGLQLKRGARLDNQSAWLPIPAVLLPDGSWGAPADFIGPKGFYGLFAAGIPTAPEGVNLVMERNDFRIEWFPEFDAAGYLLYLSSTSDVSPTKFDKVLDAGMASSITVTGLIDGQRYYFVLVAKNSAGHSPPSATLNGVFGPNGPVSGYAAYSFSQPTGAPFYVRAANVEVKLQLDGAPLTAPTISTMTDGSGQFSIPSVPAGNYVVNWVAPEGINGPSPKLLKVTGDGGALNPLAIPGKAQSLHGRVQFASGEPAGIDDDLWDLHKHARIEAFSSKGETLATVDADGKGGFALPPLPSDAYPVSLNVSYQTLLKTQIISKEPKAGEPWLIPSIAFTERLPSVVGISAWQNGVEVRQVQPGIPVQFEAIVDNPDKLPEDNRWHVIIDGKTQKQQGAKPEFTFDAITPAGGARSEKVDVRLNISDLVLTSFQTSAVIERIYRPLTSGCYSGSVGAWDPESPNVITPLHPADVNIKLRSGLSLTKPTINTTGYFETTLDSSSFDYLIRVEKLGYMRFLWPFERLPAEPLFPLVPLVTTTNTFNGTPITITQPGGIQLGVFGLQTAAGAAYTGTVKVSTATFDPTVRHPMPPGAVIDNGGAHQAAEFRSNCAWVEFRDAAGELLVPNANLVWTTGVIYPFTINETVFLQNETTGYFQAAGTATKPVGGTSFLLPITKGGFYIWARAHQQNLLRFRADRSLNYPFEVLVGSSFFPIRVVGDFSDDLKCFVPMNQPVGIKVLDLRQAPGLHFPDPAHPTTPTPAFSKSVIIRETITPTGTAPYRLQIVPLSLASSIPALRRPPATKITDLDDPDQFLGHPNASNITRAAGTRSLTQENEAYRYYEEIRASSSFSSWKRGNGFPEKFGDLLPGVAADDYTSAYYYNLGDLGFARAQSMRVKLGSDGLPDVAFYVTNYQSLEDARCERNVIATVCMDYAYKSDAYRTAHRHTRFYVYNAGGSLIPGADLDGAGQKFVPGACIICHGGSKFNPEMRLHPLEGLLPPTPEGSLPPPTPRAYVAPTGDLGSRFLPFDLESYTYHPAFGVQQQAFARMNAAVLKTMPDSTPAAPKAIPATIAAWYGNSNPLANPLGFNGNARPAGWPSAANYGAFKVGCRVCHISRDLGTGPQFTDATGFGGFDYAVCSALYMPHSQRTWSTLWGTTAARALGDTTITDLPALLHFIDGGSGGCPALPR